MEVGGVGPSHERGDNVEKSNVTLEKLLTDKGKKKKKKRKSKERKNKHQAVVIRAARL